MDGLRTIVDGKKRDQVVDCKTRWWRAIVWGETDGIGGHSEGDVETECRQNFREPMRVTLTKTASNGTATQPQNLQPSTVLLPRGAEAMVGQSSCEWSNND